VPPTLLARADEVSSLCADWRRRSSSERVGGLGTRARRRVRLERGQAAGREQPQQQPDRQRGPSERSKQMPRK